ncbi:MAG: transcriptional regulator [Ruminococcaceae bacterium]|nr:transcriptional regulator [Oscillospiraceae bacterium]
MKLLLAIVNNEDGNLVMRELNKAGFSVTKMASTGGFLRAGNTTLLVGTEEEEVQKAVDIIAKHSMKRMQVMFTPEPFIGALGNDLSSFPEEIETGGATIFVVDVERFEKI